MDGKYIIGSVGVVCVAAIEIVAISQGMNGTALAASLATITAIIGGVAGFEYGKKKSSG